MKLVLPLSPRQSCRSLVRVEFLYGTWRFCPRARAWITFLNCKSIKMLARHFLCLNCVYFSLHTQAQVMRCLNISPLLDVLLLLWFLLTSHFRLNHIYKQINNKGVNFIYSRAPPPSPPPPRKATTQNVKPRSFTRV